MSYRYVNDVGYLKFFPMSNWEDDSFCHYCGRKANILLGLEWDHVPALNVKIPDWVGDYRKTLIRSCSECNSLASDTPHLDYLSRHYWLKGAYLRRYKRLLIGDAFSESEKLGLSGYLLAAVNNHDIKYQEIISAIGFGIKSIDDIDSPILKLKTKKGRTISSLISEYMHYPDSPEESEPESSLILDCNLENESVPPPWDAEEFRTFISSENRYGANINCESSYQEWLVRNPSRASALQLPISSIDVVGFEFTVNRASFPKKEKKKNATILRKINYANSTVEGVITKNNKSDNNVFGGIYSFIEKIKNFQVYLDAFLLKKRLPIYMFDINFSDQVFQLFCMRREYLESTSEKYSEDVMCSALDYCSNWFPNLQNKVLLQFFTAYHSKSTLPIEVFLYYLLIKYKNDLPKDFESCSVQMFNDLSSIKNMGCYRSPVDSYARSWSFFISIMDSIT